MKRGLILAIVTAFVSFLLTNGGSAVGAAEEAETPPVAVTGQQIYPPPSSSGVTPTAAPPTTDTVVPPEEKARDVARRFLVAWTSYDYRTPQTIDQFTGFRSTVNAGYIKKFNELVAVHLEGIQSAKEASTGSITDIQVTEVKTTNAPEYPLTGTATVTAQVLQNVVNQDMGSAGSQVIHRYVVSLVGDSDNQTNSGTGEWRVVGLVDQSNG